MIYKLIKIMKCAKKYSRDHKKILQEPKKARSRYKSTIKKILQEPKKTRSRYKSADKKYSKCLKKRGHVI